MKQIYKDRWDKLLTFLDTLDPERFRYSHFVGSDWQGNKDLSCGTTACVAGWATAIFPELTMHKDRSLPCCIALTDESDLSLRGTDRTLAYWFGLALEEVEIIFYPHQPLWVLPYFGTVTTPGYACNRGPYNSAPLDEVVAFIRDFLKRRDAYEAEHGEIDIP